MHSNQTTPVMNPMPPVILALVLAIVLVELALAAGDAGLVGGPQAVGWRLGLVQDYGISGVLVDETIGRGRITPDLLLRFVAYPFVHLGMTHMIFGAVLLLALGKMVGEIFRPWAVLLIFFASAIVGGLVYGLITTDRIALVGAYPSVYGLIGAYTFVRWAMARAQGEPSLSAFALIGMLVFVQLAFGAIGAGGKDWIADLAGFFTGFGLSFFVSPGGWSQMLQLLRRR